MFEQMTELYEKNGYRLPKIIFWNLRMESFMVESNQNDTICLSGMSPAIMKSLLSGQPLIEIDEKTGEQI